MAKTAMDDRDAVTATAAGPAAKRVKTEAKPQADAETGADAWLAPITPAVRRAAKAFFQTSAAAAAPAEAWAAGEPRSYVSPDGRVTVDGVCFNHVELTGLFGEPLLAAAQAAVVALAQELKLNDLYHFFQTPHLQTATDPAIREICDRLYSPAFLQLIQDLTGITLTAQMDLSGHRYPPGGHLLCHDDDIVENAAQRRRIAFILYLVDADWSAAHGGALTMYEADAAGQPTPRAPKRIQPRRGLLAFFEVGNTSYHEVAEVLVPPAAAAAAGGAARALSRVSISGWFYSQDAAPRDRHRERHAQWLADWFNPAYRGGAAHPSTQQIVQHFHQEGTITLHDVVNGVTEENDSATPPAPWLDAATLAALVPAPLPISKGRYLRMPPLTKPLHASLTRLEQLQALSTTPCFRGWLSDLSGLTLGPLPVIHEVRVFRPGDYELVHDHYPDAQGLEVILCLQSNTANLPVKQVNPEQGGDVSNDDDDDDAGVPGTMFWLAEDADEPLATISPVSGSLTMVVKDAGVSSFVKYVTQPCQPRIDLHMVWPVISDDDDDDDDSGSEKDQEDNDDDGLDGDEAASPAGSEDDGASNDGEPDDSDDGGRLSASLPPSEEA
ncbi:hypothetical protein CXG81DRAFT_28212 [Caulochytrium protostelioides]|uniref:Fe2OG dioxygenase domain-containing protein n=1 Tax=Caulochytrium protostelioides TaxID=1555241 RepID=A0A4P9X1W8_9FUNG|nr:hypothetical protein CXG81DRAFT_28212 [Caulochytrium protostelioides]|eukprot:RKO99003.1 hypothetical protein CXG81DRAFT_28212 [Caulochytrium protostelioides]